MICDKVAAKKRDQLVAIFAKHRYPQDRAEDAARVWRELASAHDVFILAPSGPERRGEGYVNAARLFGPKGGEGVQAWADAKRLRQVLINLLSNATKYNRPGGSVRVQIDTLAGRARLQVIDTGQGLTEDECAHLFEPFNRLRQAHGSVEGTGIGLTVTRGLVTLMGGAITVHSTPGQGSTFGVLLPLPQA